MPDSETPEAPFAGAGPDMSEVAARLHSAACRLVRRSGTSGGGDELTPARLSALTVLVYGGARSVGELAEAEGVSSPTMSRLAASLEEAGLVRRRADASDGRVVLLESTPRGRRLLEEARSRRVREVAELLTPLQPEGLATLARAVGALERCLSGEAVGEPTG